MATSLSESERAAERGEGAASSNGGVESIEGQSSLSNLGKVHIRAHTLDENDRRLSVGNILTCFGEGILLNDNGDE